MIIKKLNFIRTCDSCPEQYDVFKDGRQVGYVRLRWGTVTCDFPDCGCDTIYSHDFVNGWKGNFDSSEERAKYLNRIATAIHAALAQEKQERKNNDWLG